MGRSGLSQLLLPFVLFCIHLSAGRLSADVYCGVYSIYGAANALGVSADIESLIDARYVSTRKGSSTADLIAAGEALGVNVTPYWHLGEAALVSSRDPLVLHFCSYGQLDSYDHWVLFLGMKDGQAIVSDSESGPSLMSISEVLLRWDGVALAVHRGDSPKTEFSKLETGSFVPWILLFLSICLIASQLKGKKAGRLLGVSGVFVVFLIASQLWSSETFLFRKSSLLYAISSHGPSRFDVISRAEIDELLATSVDRQGSKFLIVDARYPIDFSQGSLPGAVNIPVDASIKEIRTFFAKIDRDTEVVVFCLSKRCGFDRQVAVKIAGEGFAKIRIYEEGWFGWIGRKVEG